MHSECKCSAPSCCAFTSLMCVELGDVTARAWARRGGHVFGSASCTCEYDIDVRVSIMLDVAEVAISEFESRISRTDLLRCLVMTFPLVAILVITGSFYISSSCKEYWLQQATSLRTVQCESIMIALSTCHPGWTIRTHHRWSRVSSRSCVTIIPLCFVELVGSSDVFLTRDPDTWNGYSRTHSEMGMWRHCSEGNNE